MFNFRLPWNVPYPLVDDREEDIEKVQGSDVYLSLSVRLIARATASVRSYLMEVTQTIYESQRSRAALPALSTSSASCQCHHGRFNSYFWRCLAFVGMCKPLADR